MPVRELQRPDWSVILGTPLGIIGHIVFQVLSFEGDS